jgi:WD40 repeat protein
MSVNISKDSKLIATGGNDEKVTIFEIYLKRKIFEENMINYVNSVHISQDSKLIATGGADNNITIFRISKS